MGNPAEATCGWHPQEQPAGWHLRECFRECQPPREHSCGPAGASRRSAPAGCHLRVHLFRFFFFRVYIIICLCINICLFVRKQQNMCHDRLEILANCISNSTSPCYTLTLSSIRKSSSAGYYLEVFPLWIGMQQYFCLIDQCTLNAMKISLKLPEIFISPFCYL